MEFFKIRRTIPFMRYALAFNIISVATFVTAVFFLATSGLNLSIEFSGGTLMEVSYPKAAEVQNVRETLERGGLKAEVQSFGSSRDVLIRMPAEKNQSSAALSQRVQGLLAAADPGALVRRVEFVGPRR
jgi:preprotein translocase subunit SecF